MGLEGNSPHRIFIYLFNVVFFNFFFSIYFWLRWVSVAAHGISLVAVSWAALGCGAWASLCGGFSCCGAQAWASVVVAHGLSSCGLRALERRLSSCGAQALLLHGMWDIPGPGLKPVSWLDPVSSSGAPRKTTFPSFTCSNPGPSD